MSGHEEVGGLRDSLQEEIKNNNKQPLLPLRGDANANQIPMEESHAETVGTLPPLLSHSSTEERIIIWGTHARSEDPELEEFELLECQELEAFLDEEDNTGGKKGVRRDLCRGRATATSSGAAGGSALSDQNANHSREEADVDQSTQPLDLRTPASRSGGRRGLLEGRSSSENSVFISALSVVSGFSGSLVSELDSAGRAQLPASLPSKPTSDKSRIQQPTSHQALLPSPHSREQPRDVDHNHNAATCVPSQGAELKHRGRSTRNGSCPAEGQSCSVERGYNRQENGLLSKFQRNLERVPPSRRQLVRPLSPETEQRATSGHTGHVDPPRGQQPYRSPDPGPKASSHQSDPKETAETGTDAQSLGSGSGIQSCPSSTKVGSVFRRQGSAEQAPSPVDRKSHFSRRAYSSPTRPSTPPSPRTTGSPQRRPPMSPMRTRVAARAPQLGFGSSLRPPVKTSINTSVQTPPPQLGYNETSPPSKSPPKPKSVRPKIITYIRKSPQVKPQALDGPYEASSLPTRLSACPSSPSPQPPTGDAAGPPAMSASNLLYDKYRQELQKARMLPTGLMVSGIKPPSQTMPHKAAGRALSFYGSLSSKYPPAGIGSSPVALRPPVSGSEDPSEAQMATQETRPLFRSPRTLRPQLGVGAVSRAPPTAIKSRIFTGQKSPLAISQPVQAVTPSVTLPMTPPTTPPPTPPATSSVTPSVTSSVAQSPQSPPEPLDQRRPSAVGLAARSLLPKPATSGLRPPGYSRLPPARLAAFGFVRSSSASSVSSSHSADSTRSDPCRLEQCGPSSVSDDPPFHRVITASSGDGPRAPCRSSPQPPSTPVPTRRLLLPPPPASPVGSHKESQIRSDGPRSALSSPKRLAVVTPKPQSPVLQRQRAAAVVSRTPGASAGPATPLKERDGGSPGAEKRKEEARKKEKEREEQERREEEVLRLQARCEEQAGQMLELHARLRRSTQGLDAFLVCTQHFSLKSENAEKKHQDLSVELSKIREEVDFTTARWERLQQEKAELEYSFKHKLKQLQEQQEYELVALEEELRTRHASDSAHLKAEHQSQVEELRTQQQEQIEELTAQHESALEDLRTMHNITMATLQEEHARTMRDLRKAHEQQKATLESDFESHRQSLKDEVDMLTFQNRALQDKAKRFEEALRRSSDEQIVDALAPYQHIEQDLKSLKEVLEMKNQQIHDQERKICHLEKVAQKNLYLEEKVQVLQQQNEDLKARIDRNVAMSRQLSEENANLQENVERESNEKKRLSRDNEELLWRLQTSPHLSPCSSPSHRAFFPGTDIPYSPGPGTPTHSYSPGPRTPVHRVVSPGPATPTHRGSPTAKSSPARIPNANTLPR
ncbi:microtubule-associated tumor suppressor candidate 2 isoform X2 [Brachyhypopomus gauderio]|uniref:microtubule-associated tumor suppressor candidate 2 isoform X2 n=1 Tax=Brachyhypopomus gauderio TaxID=698409 RepID=UPI0040436FE7